MPSIGTRKRLVRITRRALPETREAFAQGRISARRADQLLYLPVQEQLAELNRILTSQEDAARRRRIAATVIRQYVHSGKRDLVALRKDLQLALAPSTT